MMKISVLEGSEYFRGLLLLIARDRAVAEPEAALMMRIGRTLGLEKEFCEGAVREILENSHVSSDPPVFSSPVLARMFIRDGLTIAAADRAVHEAEEEWLRLAAQRNGVGADWYEAERDAALAAMPRQGSRLELDDLVVEYLGAAGRG